MYTIIPGCYRLVYLHAQFLFLCFLSLMKLWTRRLTFLASLWFRVVVVGVVGGVGRTVFVTHSRLRAHDV